MSAHTADSQLTFHLPTLSYIDAKWEEPNLSAALSQTRKAGLAAWLSRRVAALIAWRDQSRAMAELTSMTDHELMDIGLSRADLGRAFNPAFNADLRQRGAAG